MATMRDIIVRAFRKASITGVDTNPTATEIDEGLTALNGMLHEWKLRGVDISHSTLALNGTFPIGPEYEDGTAYLLASRLSPDYLAPVSFDADDFFRTIQAAYMTIATVSLDKAVTEVPSKKARDGTLGYYY